MSTNKSTISVNYATPEDLSGEGLANGIGTIDYDLDAGTYHYDGRKKYIIVNNASVVNIAENVPSSPVNIKFIKDGYKLMFGDATTISAGAFSEVTRVSDMISSLYLGFWAPKKMTSPTTASNAERYYSATINSMFNIGNSPGFTQLALKLEYRKNQSAVYVYKQLDAPSNWAPAGDVPRRGYSLFTNGDTVILSDELEDGEIVPFNVGTPTGDTFYKSSTVNIPAEKVLDYFGVNIADIDKPSTIKITPVLFIGELGSPYESQIQSISSSSAIIASASVPAVSNNASIAISNTDSTNNKDGYTDGYGWIGTYNSSQATDSSITLVIGAGV